jgi:hypothetical protein
MLHFSGDTDGAVGPIGTQNWIDKVGYNTTEDWRPYFYPINETKPDSKVRLGGYI